MSGVKLAACCGRPQPWAAVDKEQAGSKFENKLISECPDFEEFATKTHEFLVKSVGKRINSTDFYR